MAQQQLSVTNLGANATVDLLTGADQGEVQGELRRPSLPTRFELLLEATATGVEVEVFSGIRQVVFRSPVSSTGTAGQAPNRETLPSINWSAASFEQQRIILRETAGAGTIDLEAVLLGRPAA